MNMDWYDLLSLAVALVCGAALGFERELHHKTAGLRTNMLICIGAALFIIIARIGHPDFDQIVARVIAGIVTGVGFIGAGAVIQDRKGVHGITTAAAIWINAGIGIAAGMRFYLLAAVVTVMVLLILWLLSPVSRWLQSVRESVPPPQDAE